MYFLRHHHSYYIIQHWTVYCESINLLQFNLKFQTHLRWNYSSIHMYIFYVFMDFKDVWWVIWFCNMVQMQMQKRNENLLPNKIQPHIKPGEEFWNPCGPSVSISHWIILCQASTPNLFVQGQAMYVCIDGPTLINLLVHTYALKSFINPFSKPTRALKRALITSIGKIIHTIFT